jgi:hypothetical protein
MSAFEDDAYEDAAWLQTERREKDLDAADSDVLFESRRPPPEWSRFAAVADDLSGCDEALDELTTACAGAEGVGCVAINTALWKHWTGPFSHEESARGGNRMATDRKTASAASTTAAWRSAAVATATLRACQGLNIGCG